MSAMPSAVSIHALDAGGGEGLIADAAVFAELDCRAVCVATSVVASLPLSAPTLAAQLEAAGREPVGAVRVGFLRGAEQVELAVEFARKAAPEATVVSWGASDPETQAQVERALVPAARVVVARASAMSLRGGRAVTDLPGLKSAVKELRDRGARAAIVAGLSARGRVMDLLDDGGAVVLFDTTRIQASRVDGLAGAHAAALAAHLARGLALASAAEAAQRYIGFRLRRGR